MVDIHSIARRLAAEKEGRMPPPVPVWVYLLLAFAVLLSCIALGLIDHSRSG